MAETHCIKIKLKPGTTTTVVQWLRDLAVNREEVAEAVREEGIVVESVFLERAADGDYLLLYQKAQSLQRANEAFAASMHPVNVAMRRMILETWESVQGLEMLFDFEEVAQD